MSMNVLPVIKSVVNNHGVVHFVNDPVLAISAETACKATFRPAFTLIDMSASADARKYSAAKECIYQLLCLAIYLTMAPKFKKLGFVIGKKIIGEKAGTGFKKFTDYNAVKNYIKEGNSLLKNFPIVNGSMLFGTIVGSIIALTIVAPQIVHLVLPHVLNAFNIKLDEHKNNNSGPDPNKPSLDIYQLEDGKTVSIPKNVTALQMKQMR